MLNSFNGVMDQLGDLQLRVDEQRRRQQRLSIIKSSVSSSKLTLRAQNSAKNIVFRHICNVLVLTQQWLIYVSRLICLSWLHDLYKCRSNNEIHDFISVLMYFYMKCIYNNYFQIRHTPRTQSQFSQERARLSTTGSESASRGLIPENHQISSSNHRDFSSTNNRYENQRQRQNGYHLTRQASGLSSVDSFDEGSSDSHRTF